ncbi:MAG: xanthine dehydrogenase family protein [Acetobacteraceae bacterium]|nr:xanthine dehydrogenase family protein [Acetobacteraceae bacterium]
MLFTSADLDGVAPIRPLLHKFGYVPIAQPVLARDVVRYTGDLVAAIVADSEEGAEDIAEQVELDIEPHPAVVDAGAALAPDAPLVHDEAAGNVVIDARLETPDFARRADTAARRITCAVRSRRQNASPIEPRAAHAVFDPASGRVTLTCTTQTPHMMRTAIADLLGMAEADLRVVAPDVGGGFGQKMSLAPEFVVLVWLARRLRGSVAWTEDRRENLMASFHGRDMSVALDGAFDAEGRLVALAGDVVANVGAYAPFPNTAAVEPLMSLAELPGPYALSAYRCRARGVVTNTCPSAPYRGVARPAITLAVERLMDKAARALGLAPWDIRRRNLVADFPYVSATGLAYDSGTYREALELALAAADIPAFQARQASLRARGRYLGLGLSTFCERTGYGSPAFAARGMDVTPGWETVELAIDPSGLVEARIGASPHGQGLATSLAQIIADKLGVTPGAVRVVHGDTDRTPYGFGTFASRSLVISGGAVTIAAESLRTKLIAMASTLLEAAPVDIALSEGAARVAGTDRAIALPQLARAAYHQAHRFPGLSPGLRETATYDPAGTFSNACHLAIVEVDAETCAVSVERFIVAEDAGRLVNPMIAEGQIRGGVAQGIANALYEEIVYNEAGDILTASLADYLLPTAREVPRIEVHHLETVNDASLTGAKGLGEGGTIGAPAAILNAINDALAPLGAEVDAIPATPRRIHAALQAAGARGGCA